MDKIFPRVVHAPQFAAKVSLLSFSGYVIVKKRLSYFTKYDVGAIVLPDIPISQRSLIRNKEIGMRRVWVLI